MDGVWNESLGSPDRGEGSVRGAHEGITRPDLEGLAWLARQGSADASYRLGRALMDCAHPECVLWFHAAANQGHAGAAATLGFMYLSGVPAGVQHAKSFRWFCVAADLGDSAAQRRLGMMYERGFCCKRDLQKASEWYGRAAAQGDVEACFLARAARDRMRREARMQAVLSRWPTLLRLTSIARGRR